ncbi:MAG: hypothetical protein DMG24_02980 [Acidobacteria bacterium]|nr:MAG: hypothetical protein DMG24_02980 [Acidobacteriota bacterium]
MDYAQILPQLFLGSYPRSIDDIDRLRQESAITAVLNLQTDADMRSHGLFWGPLKAHYAACGITLRRVAVRDYDALHLRYKLPECVRALDRLLTPGHLVYLHCTAGVGRSPSVAIAYLHWCGAWALDDAAAHVIGRRVCSPNVEAIRLANWHPANRKSPPRPQADQARSGSSQRKRDE